MNFKNLSIINILIIVFIGIILISLYRYKNIKEKFFSPDPECPLSKDDSCFDHKWPCTICCETDKNRDGDLCWDQNYTKDRCCRQPPAPAPAPAPALSWAEQQEQLYLKCGEIKDEDDCNSRQIKNCCKWKDAKPGGFRVQGHEAGCYLGENTNLLNCLETIRTQPTPPKVPAKNTVVQDNCTTSCPDNWDDISGYLGPGKKCSNFKPGMTNPNRGNCAGKHATFTETHTGTGHHDTNGGETFSYNTPEGRRQWAIDCQVSWGKCGWEKKLV